MAFVPTQGFLLAPDDTLLSDAADLNLRMRERRLGAVSVELPCAGSIVSPECFAMAVAGILSPLRGYTRRLTREDGEDLLQDTLVRAWGARRGFEPGSNFKAWLFRIARNRFLSDLRRSGRSVQWNAEVHDPLLVSAPVQDEGLHQRDLGHALAGLPSSQREALLLVGEEGLSYEEAAERTGEAIGTMKSRVSRGRAGVIAHFTANLVTRPGVPIEASAPESDLYARWKRAGPGTIG